MGDPKTAHGIRMSRLVQRMLYLQGKPFSIEDYPYLHAIYDSTAPTLLLKTARQVSKSTFLASMLVPTACLYDGSSQICVSPLQEQANVFSMTRLREFIHDSPIVKQGYFTGDVVDQVLRKQFSNGSQITLGYAQRTADRLRGRSILAGMHRVTKRPGKPCLAFDEVQDILPDVVPVIKETAFRVPDARYLFSGTPKSTGNYIEAIGKKCTGAEWAVRCPATGCKKWNLEWDERNIGHTGVICRHCGQPLDSRPGEWVVRRKLDIHKGKDALVTGESFRIPQLIVQPIMSRPSKWLELLDKQRSYSVAQFRNEVLGLSHDSGSQPVTLEQLRACCSQRPNHLPQQDPGLPPLTLSIDWAFVGEESRTVFMIGGWDPFPAKYKVYWVKHFMGNETDALLQIQQAVDLVKNLGIAVVGADWGAGQVQNLELIRDLGEEKVCQLWHTGAKASGNRSRGRARFDAVGRKWHLARTAVMTDTFESIRRGEVEFPRVEDCGMLFDDILAVTAEYSERSNNILYTHVNPDDGMHALVFGMLASELYLKGDFRAHAGQVQTTSPQVLAEDFSGQMDTFDTLYM
jgi:hypothetical protein